MYSSPTRRRRVHFLGNGFIGFVLLVAFAAAISRFGVGVVDNQVVSAARWVADHSGATRASEMWRANGKPKLDDAVTTGYQFLRQSAASVLDYLDSTGPSSRALEKIGRAAAGANSKAQTKDNAAPAGNTTQKAP